MNRRDFLFTNVLGGAAVLAARYPAFAVGTAVEAEIDALIKKLTLDEKIQFLRGDGDFSSIGNKRLNVPGISMADSPQGVRIEGNATVFPSPVAMAASWDAALIERVGAALGRELKAKGRDVLLGPCVNIHRSPLGGRNVESFGEDPLLSGIIATAYIKGVQSENVAACVKHFAANNIETRRLFLDVTADLRYLHEIELPPFKMAVQDGGALAVMASYNQVNGHYSWANRYLLTDILRKSWNYKGVIVSDWGCEWMLPEDRSVLESIDAGLNVHMPSGYYFGNSLAKFVKEGKVRESRIDELVKEIITVVNKLELPGNPKKIDQSQTDTVVHHALARETAASAIVLLKNDKELLPLNKEKVRSLAVIGPNADIAQLGDRGSVFAPTSYKVTPLDGLKNKLGESVSIAVSRGFEITNFKTIPATSLISPDGKKGLFGELFATKDFEGKPALTAQAETIRFDWGKNLPKEVAGGKTFTARWSGKLRGDSSRKVFLGLRSDGASKLYIDERLLIENVGTWETKVDPKVVKYARIDLEKGKDRDIRVEYSKGESLSAVELVWAEEPANPFAEAVELAKKSEYAIIFAGLNIDYEGEGLDRFDMHLPDLQNELIEAVVKANPKTIVAINSGTPNDMRRWIDRTLAVLQAWYLGVEGGNAIADVLFGDVNPSGRLPVTFGQKREDYGDFPFSTVANDKITYGESIYVGYRHFDTKSIVPLFPFGHGLSYTQFAYDRLRIASNKDTVSVDLVVENVGSRPGTEVVQLYVAAKQSRLPRPLKELKGFRKISLNSHASQPIKFELTKSDLSYFDPNLKEWIFESGEYEILIGSSSRDIRVRGDFNTVGLSNHRNSDRIISPSLPLLTGFLNSGSSRR